jgi:hypothetical protein
MEFPTVRLTITAVEYALLRPGLEILANGLADATLGHFPHHHPWHQIDRVASNVYLHRAYDETMSARVIGVRGKLWNLSQSRKIRIDAFELLVLALALRLSKARTLVGNAEVISTEIRLLQTKLETYRKRAKCAATARMGKAGYRLAADRWRRFLAWSRYTLLYTKLPPRGQIRRSTLWREQRQQFATIIARALERGFYEPLSERQMARIVTLGTTTLRRGRHSVGLREMFGNPDAHHEYLVEFVTKRVSLERLPGAPVPAWKAMMDRAEVFRAYQENSRGKVVSLSTASPGKTITEGQQNPVVPTKVVSAHRSTHNHHTLTPEMLCNAMAEWLYQNVTLKFNLTQQVCDEAHFQIKNASLDQYRVAAVAKSFSGLISELRPTEFSDDLAILIGQYAGWLLGCLLALGQNPGWMYQAIGEACARAKQLESTARYDKWIATTPYGSQSVSLNT